MMPDRDLRRAALIAAHGRPVPFDAAAALALLGLSGKVDPAGVIAFAYPSHAAASAWADANRRHHGHPHLGSVLVEGAGVVGVTDLRPALAAARARAGRRSGAPRART